MEELPAHTLTAVSDIRLNSIDYLQELGEDDSLPLLISPVSVFSSSVPLVPPSVPLLPTLPSSAQSPMPPVSPSVHPQHPLCSMDLPGAFRQTSPTGLVDTLAPPLATDQITQHWPVALTMECGSRGAVQATYMIKYDLQKYIGSIAYVCTINH